MEVGSDPFESAKSHFFDTSSSASIVFDLYPTAAVGLVALLQG
jgi:hypothetical protein